MLGCKNPWPNLPTELFWKGLAWLTQLTALYVHLPLQPLGSSLAPLTGCTGLETLEIEYSTPNGRLEKLEVVSTVSQGLNA